MTTVKKLIWKLVLPLTIISFTVFTKWWYVLPVDAPDTMLFGFPLPYVGPGWHTSLSLQFFVLEFIIDLGVFFAFWLLITVLIDRYVLKLRTHIVSSVVLLTISGLIIIGGILIASNKDNRFHVRRNWEMDVMTTGYKFIWQHRERPDFNKYDPKRK